MKTYEVNFDGLIGPTHNYSGLSLGNFASQTNAHQAASPRAAALQGLAKMESLITRGYKQGFFPPQQRPRLDLLHSLGFCGSDTSVLQQVAKRHPELLSLVYSASSMWAANAATVTASLDTPDKRVHFTPANLLATPHRTIESNETYKNLRFIFNDDKHFQVHPALPTISGLGDEGAANHSRLCESHGTRGTYVFVYGRDHNPPSNLNFPARQCRVASESVARQHGLQQSQCVFLQQSVTAINAGAFHNDVVAVANNSVMLYHEQAFELKREALRRVLETQNFELQLLEVGRDMVNLGEAVQSYLFNSQLLSQANGGMTLLAPRESELNPAVQSYLQQLISDTTNPINEVVFMELRESMRNGGGPACLRLRIVLNEEELAACHPAFLLSLEKILELKDWVARHYRATLNSADLADPSLLNESYSALDELTQIMGISGYYDFQRE